MSGPPNRCRGTVVRLRYRAGASLLFPYHNRVGVVLQTARPGGKSNHVVQLAGDGRVVHVPAGHLRLAGEKGNG